MVLIDIAFKTMIKIATLLFLLFVPVIIAGSAGRIVTPAVAQVTATPTPPAKATDNGREIAVGIKALTLSAEYISRECDPKWNRLTVDVSARSDAPDERPLKYHYFVDGGKIIGSGSKVKWDLGDAKKGTYHITAAVDDGCGFCGRTVTKAVTVIGVSDCECECPSISIGRNLYSVQNGDTIKFFANVKGGTAQEPTFNWIVQNGSIKAGQGTAHLVVEAKQNGTSRLKVSLEMSGTEERCNCCGICGKTVTKYVKVISCPIGISDVDCPVLSVKAPPSISGSTEFVFTALVSRGGQPDDVTYTWSVENADIIDGQNTPVVKIRIPENAADTKVIVKLSIGGIPEDWNCLNEVTKTYENGQLLEEPR